LFNDGARTPREDVLFFTEAGRQASLAVTHAFLNVSLDDVFIFDRSEAALTEAIWSPRQSPSDSVVIEIKIKETARRKNAISRVVANHRMSVGNELVFYGTGTWTIQSASLFRRLRRTLEVSSPGSADRPDAPGGNGPDRLEPYPDNVVISSPEYLEDGAVVAASLIVDRTHPYFFDHPCDHVPGMLLLEGCVQLAVGAFAESAVAASKRPAVVAYDVDFTQFVECGLPTTLKARMTAGQGRGPGAIAPPIEIVISQRGITAGIATMSVAYPI
jgi:hypothetical protein